MDITPFSRRDILLNGWLVTKSHGRLPFRQWKPYWCVLAGDQIFYFRQAGAVPLKGCRLLSRTSHDPEEPLGFVLELHPQKCKLGNNSSEVEGRKHGKPYSLCSPKQAELDLWEREVRKVRGGIFGQSLEDTITNESESTTRRIPNIVEVCVEYLRKYGLKEEGIFRLNGRNGTVQDLQDEIDKGEVPDFKIRNTSVHTVASLLKRYLTLLPEPVIPWRHCRYFIPAMQRLQENEADGQDQLIMQLALLPRANYNLLKYLCDFLHEVHRSQIYNKMGLGNLANIFAPHILRPEHAEGQFLLGSTALSLQLVHYLIRYHDVLFPPFSFLQSPEEFHHPQEFVDHNRLVQECAERASLQELPLPRETEALLGNNVVNIHLPEEENDYSNGEIIERNSRDSRDLNNYNRIYENIEIPLPKSSSSAGSLIEALKSSISPIPPKPKVRTDHRAKRHGVSNRDSISVFGIDVGQRSLSNASSSRAIKSTNLSDDSKELGILYRGKKPKWQKGSNVHTHTISTYQNLELGTQPLAHVEDPKVAIMNLKNTKCLQHRKDSRRGPQNYPLNKVLLSPSQSTPENRMKRFTDHRPVPVPRHFNGRRDHDESCSEDEQYEVKFMATSCQSNLNRLKPAVVVKGLKSRLKDKEDDLSRQQRLLERLRKDLATLRNRLAMEELARRQAEDENELLNRELETLRHRLGSI